MDINQSSNKSGPPSKAPKEEVKTTPPKAPEVAKEPATPKTPHQDTPMSYYYHYADDEFASTIIRSGRKNASVDFLSANNDASFGNGVYLTKASPETHTRAQVAMNNWGKTTDEIIEKTKNYFVFKMPDSDVRDASDGVRSIYLLDGREDLILHNYPWWLKEFDSGLILSSYKYQMLSFGPVSLMPSHRSSMGEYRMSDINVNGRPVYEHEESGQKLFLTSRGKWGVGPDAGNDYCSLVQVSQCDLGPDSNVPWEYVAGEKVGNGPLEIIWKKDDPTLRAFAWQK